MSMTEVHTALTALRAQAAAVLTEIQAHAAALDTLATSVAAEVAQPATLDDLRTVIDRLSAQNSNQAWTK